MKTRDRDISDSDLAVVTSAHLNDICAIHIKYMNDFDVLNCINNNVFDGNIDIRSRILKSSKTHYILQISNRKIWDEAVDIYKLCCNKTDIMKFPDLEEKYLSHFVRGLVDTDGSFYMRNNKLGFTYTSCSFEFIQKLQEILIKYCKVNDATIYFDRRHKNTCYSIMWRNKKDPHAIGQWIYNNSGNNRGERKFNIWLKSYINSEFYKNAIKNKQQTQINLGET